MLCTIEPQLWILTLDPDQTKPCHELNKVAQDTNALPPNKCLPVTANPTCMQRCCGTVLTRGCRCSLPPSQWATMSASRLMGREPPFLLYCRISWKAMRNSLLPITTRVSASPWLCADSICSATPGLGNTRYCTPDTIISSFGCVCNHNGTSSQNAPFHLGATPGLYSIHTPVMGSREDQWDGGAGLLLPGLACGFEMGLRGRGMLGGSSWWWHAWWWQQLGNGRWKAGTGRTPKGLHARTCMDVCG